MEFETYINFTLNERFGFSFQAEFKILAGKCNFRILKFFEISILILMNFRGICP